MVTVGKWIDSHLNPHFVVKQDPAKPSVLTVELDMLCDNADLEELTEIAHRTISEYESGQSIMYHLAREYTKRVYESPIIAEHYNRVINAFRFSFLDDVSIHELSQELNKILDLPEVQLELSDVITVGSHIENILRDA